MDDTLCEYTDDEFRKTMQYDKAVPKSQNIEIINGLHNKGHTIVIWTSRGIRTGIDWKSLTIYQLYKWNVLYDSVQCTKPYFDLFLDDKALNSIYHFEPIWIDRVLNLKHK